LESGAYQGTTRY